MPILRRSVDTPLGPITLAERDGAIVALDWGAAREQAETPLLRDASRQVDAYFNRRLQRFELPLAPSGTPFDHAVWEAMVRIPYGATRSYAAIARTVGGVARAVGTACARNPIPILIPCHRIVAAGDRLGGYSGKGGAETKRFLLALEGAELPLPPVTAPDPRRRIGDKPAASG